MATSLIFAIVLMLDVGTPIDPTKPVSATTRAYVLPAEYATSEECQRMALTFIKAKGYGFKGKPNTPYKGIEGTIVGAWCTVAPMEKKK